MKSSLRFRTMKRVALTLGLAMCWALIPTGAQACFVGNDISCDKQALEIARKHIDACEYSAAKSDLNSLEQRHPTSWELHLLLSLSNFETGDYLIAEEEATRSIIC